MTPKEEKVNRKAINQHVAVMGWEETIKVMAQMGEDMEELAKKMKAEKDAEKLGA